jgi:methylenetetrahydrofolate--tRNA-(uracil-5-)-methyltransferase
VILNNQNNLKFDFVNVIGAGLAGSEAALYLANNGVRVKLYEMKKIKKTPAQTNENFAELVCSNSLKSTDDLTASGLLKKEIELLGSSLLKVAYDSSVPAGSALAVDREVFSKKITKLLQQHENIEIIDEIVTNIDTKTPTIIATGPLTEDSLFDYIKNLLGEQNCYFYDAIAPIIYTESLEKDKTFVANRYNKSFENSNDENSSDEKGDYINCTLDKAEYELFCEQLIKAERAPLKDFEKVFESCMPIEIMARRGLDALRYGPMKPVGLYDENGKKPYAVLQLRKESKAGTLVNMVGFQTNLTYGEQKRVFSLIPALKNAKFLRFGQMHRNSYINAPASLNEFSQLKNHPIVFIAGQLSGVEGYMESIASGLFCAINMLQLLKEKQLVALSEKTVLGAMMKYISSSPQEKFVPVNSNFGIVYYDGQVIKDKKLKRENMKNQSIFEIEKVKEKLNGN